MRKLFVLAVAALSAFAAQAQADYPTAPIRIINISSPGAGGDAIARMLAEKMTPIVKGTFIMDNRPGAGGAIAADAGAKAKPDGYTLLFGGFTSHVLLAAVRPNLSYDPAKDFDPVGQIGTASILLIATNDFPANNLKEFIAQAKKAPDSIQYASWGVGSTGHFCGELLNQRAQIKTSHVPYKSVTQIQQDILGGQIKVAFVDMASGTPMVKGVASRRSGRASSAARACRTSAATTTSASASRARASPCRCGRSTRRPERPSRSWTS